MDMPLAQPLKVLIVGDNKANELILVQTLNAAGFAPSWSRVDNEVDFESQLNPTWDAILADFQLPRFDSRSALQLLKRKGLDIPLIIVSGSIGEDLAVGAIREGAADYLLKDQLSRLGQAVSQALEQRRLREAHQRAEAQAAQWRSRYEVAVLATGHLLYDWNPITDEVIYGGDIERILGYTAGEMNGGLSRWLEIMHPDDLGPFLEQVERVRSTGSPFQMQLRVIRKDGTILHCEDRGHFLRDAAGQLIRMIGFVVDISDQKRAERELLESRRMLETVLNAIPVGVFWKDRHSRYLGCNRTVAHAFGFASESELVGKSDLDIPCLTREQADFFRAKDREVMESGQSQMGIIEPATLIDGRNIWMETSKLPLIDSNGEVRGVLGVWQDVTERRRMEEQARQSTKMEAIGRLAGGVAHDFNNLLTVINGYGKLLLKDFDGDDSRYEMIQQICRAGGRAAGLTKQLLAFGRKGMLVPIVLDLNELLTDMSKLLSPMIGEDIEVIVRTAPDLWSVKVDPDEMGRVVMNLAVNARDAMPRGAQLVLETTNGRITENSGDVPPGQYVVLSIQDTGQGMAPETRTRLFEPFFTTKRADKGTGLGLATVYGIVKQSGGHIEVASELGVGSTFRVYLPRAEGAPVPLGKSHQAARAASRGHETILLAEDEPGVRKLARLVLSRAGYTVIEAHDGNQAIALCSDSEHDLNAVDLLISDVVMPSMSGPQLAERLQSLRPDLQVLYLSGYTDDAMLHHGVREGEAAFLQKPFSADALLQKVRELLDRRAGADHRRRVSAFA